MLSCMLCQLESLLKKARPKSPSNTLVATPPPGLILRPPARFDFTLPTDGTLPCWSTALVHMNIGQRVRIRCRRNGEIGLVGSVRNQIDQGICEGPDPSPFAHIVVTPLVSVVDDLGTEDNFALYLPRYYVQKKMGFVTTSC